MCRGNNCASAAAAQMPRRPVGRAAIYDMYAYAKTIEVENRVAFPQAFTRAFDEAVPRLNDHDAYVVTRWLEVAPGVFREALQTSLDQQRAKDNIGQSDAVGLIWAYLAFSAYRSFAPLVDALVAEDDDRRYAIDRRRTGKNLRRNQHFG